MKRFFTNALRFLLRVSAAGVVGRYAPGVIGITGSVGKTSTKEAIAAVLRQSRPVRASRGNFNGEIGLPLAVIGQWSEGDMRAISREAPPGAHRIRKVIFFCKVLGTAFLKLLFRGAYPELLVLEYGADKPGDIGYLLAMVRPHIAVVTAVGKIPVHVEFYENPDAVGREKARLVEQLMSTGFAVLNADDETVVAMREKTRAQVMTFGFSKNADMRVSTFETRVQDGKIVGVSFKLEYAGSIVPVRIDGCLGRPVAYAAAAAACVGVVFGINLVRIADALADYRPQPHRMSIVRGVKESTLIDDSYNASPLSTEAALEALGALSAGRTVGVLGDMLELGPYAQESHERTGTRAAKALTVLITVGPRARFIAQAAQAAGMPRKNVISFETAEEAAGAVPDLIKRGDLVLIKASRAVHLEKVVHALALEPETSV